MFRGSFFGQSINVLVDTGATTSFISKSFVDQHQVPVSTLPDADVLNVRLGNNSLEKVDKFTQGELFLGDNVAFSIKPHVMRLPVDCHVIAGLDFIEAYDAWLHPKSRQMNVMVEGKQHVIAHMRVDTDMHGFMHLRDEGSLQTYGAYKTANLDWDVQSCSKKQMRNYLKTFDRGNLSYSCVETFEEKAAALHCSHLASGPSEDAPEGLLNSGRLGCDFQDLPGTTGKPGVYSRGNSGSKSECDSESIEQDVFRVIVQFHPDGKFTVCSDESEITAEPTEIDTDTLAYVADTACTCASIFSDSSASKEPFKNMYINVQDTATATSAPTDHSRGDDSPGKLPMSASIEKLPSNHPQRKFLNLAEVQGQKHAGWADDPGTFMQHVFSMSQEPDEALIGVYPINEKLIDASEECYLEWVNRVLRHEFGHFTCLEEIKRWQPLESDPLLKLNLKEGKVPVPMKYRIPVHMLPQLKEFVRDMLEKNFIIPNPGSTHSAPMLVLKKPPNHDGTSRGFRLVTDFRNLNQCLDAPQFWMPEVSSTQEKLRGAKYLTTLDMKNGYWNSGVHKDSVDLLSFSTPWGTFSYQVVPQGLISSAAWFQHWTEQKLRKHGVLLEHAPFDPGDESDIEEDEPDEPVDANNNCMSHFSDENCAMLAASKLSEYASETVSLAKADSAERKLENANDPHQLKRSQGYVACYCDDLIIVSKSAEEHKKHILDLFQILSDERIYLQPTKSKIFCKYVRYLGMVVGNDCLLEDPAKIRAIVEMPAPRNSQTEVRGFLGMASFWRRFIADFAGVVQPMNALLKKGCNVKTTWSEIHDKAVFDIKKALISYPVLRHYDPNRPVWVITDASDYAIGGVLAQKDDDGVLYAVAYVSRALHHAELNYSVQEKECLGIVFAVQKFRHYLLCNRFTIRCQTDHSSLVFLSRPSESSGRIARWSMIMAEYSYSVEHIPGVDNHVPDQLSRLIKRPDNDWFPLDCDMDTDTNYPFMMCYPAVLHCLQTAVAKGPILNTLEDRAWAPIEHKLNCATGYPNVNVIGATPLQYNLETNCYEQVQRPDTHLTYAAPNYRLEAGLLKFSAKDYLECSEFSIVYGMLTKMASYQAKLFAILRSSKGTNVRSTDEEFFSHDASTRHSDVTDSDLFSDMVAQQVLDAGTDSGVPKIPGEIGDQDFDAKKVRAAVRTAGKNLVPTDPDFWTREETSTVSLYNVCFLERGYLYRVLDGKELLCIPNIKRKGESVRYQIYEQFHDDPLAGHRGIVPTYTAMRRRVYWKNMDQDIGKYVKSCTCCQMNKKNRRAPQGKRAAMQIPRQIAESYNIDFLTDLPPATEQKFDMAMIVVDRFSQRVFVIPTWKIATGPMCAEQFHDEITCRNVRGVPRELISDRDVRFISTSVKKKTFWEAFQRRMGTCTRFTSARNQAANGSAERAIAVIEEILMCYLNYEQTNWVGILPHLIFAINNSPSRALHGVTPIFCELGFHPKMPMDLQSALDRPTVDTDDKSVEDRVQRLTDLRAKLRDSIVAARDDVAQRANSKRRKIDKELLVDGAKCWLSLEGINLPEFNLRASPKLSPLWFGPYQVLRRPSENSFTLDLPLDIKIHNTFHVSKLKPFYEGDFKNFSKARQLPAQYAQDPEYEISRIVDNKFQFGMQFYLVAYKGYSEVNDTEWFRRDNLMVGAKKLILEYERKLGIDCKGNDIVSGNPPTKRVRRKKKK